MEEFKLEMQDPERMEKDSLITEISNIEDLEDLKDLAFTKPEIAEVFNEHRYNHLKEKMEGFSDRYTGLDSSGYLLDTTKSKTSDHITQIDYPSTDEEFLTTVKVKLIETLEKTT